MIEVIKKSGDWYVKINLRGYEGKQIKIQQKRTSGSGSERLEGYTLTYKEGQQS